MTLSIRTDGSGQTVYNTQIRLLLKEQSDLGPHCLLMFAIPSVSLDALLYGKSIFFGGVRILGVLWYQNGIFSNLGSKSLALAL